MRKYKEWTTNNAYGSFWDFGPCRGKIRIVWNSSTKDITSKVLFFHPETFVWKEVWDWQWENVTKMPTLEEFYKYEKEVCEDITQLIDGG